MDEPAPELNEPTAIEAVRDCEGNLLVHVREPFTRAALSDPFGLDWEVCLVPDAAFALESGACDWEGMLISMYLRCATLSCVLWLVCLLSLLRTQPSRYPCSRSRAAWV